MKKLVSLLLAFILVFASCVSAFAGSYGGYSGDTIIITSRGGSISGSYLSSSDAVARRIKAAGSAENFVREIGLTNEVSGIFDSYKIANSLYEFKGSGNVTVTFTCTGVKSTDTVALLVYDGSSWDLVKATAGSGNVTATLDKFGKVAVLVGTAVNIPGGSVFFEDVLTTDWFYEAVMYCAVNGYLKGLSDTKFGPGVTLTRAMVATVIYRVEGSPAHAIDYPFKDCKDSWYQAGIAWAFDKGVVTGYSDDAFGPNDPVTREQLVAMFGRYYQYKGNTLSGGSVDKFSDAGSISRYAVPYVQWAVGRGLLNGRAVNGKALLVPTGRATRAEFAQVLYNYMH